MRNAVGLRWERALALIVSVVLTLVVALTVVGALPAQAAEHQDTGTVTLVVDDTSVTYGGGSFGTRALLRTLGNSWG